MGSKDSPNQQRNAQNVSNYREIIRQTVAECETLSDKTKKEVLQWFSTNCNRSRQGSPCSTGSPIFGSFARVTGSRKSGLRSDNTSELNLEVPKKRRKLSELDESLSDKENDHPIDGRHVQTDTVKKNNLDWDDANSNQRKSSPSPSTSSSTIELDPDHNIVQQKNRPAGKPTDFSSTEHVSEKQSVKKSFMASLSKDVPLENADSKAVGYRVEYTYKKQELCKVLYKEFNKKVFDGQLPKDLPIEWSDKLLTAAGKYKYYQPSSKSSEKTSPSSRIVLASKILDSPDKLRDTLIHEMCHAAARLINNVRDGHGSIWKSWANKAVEAFPELNTISRCHDYEIETKYTYRCTCCGYGYGRQVTSLKLDKHRCRYCHGPFELLINKITDAGVEQKLIAASTNEPTEFALYVKKKYRVLKESETFMEHAEIILILKQQFSVTKANSKQEK